MKQKEFGFYPIPLHIEEGSITISTLPGLESKVSKTNSSNMVDKGWIYAPSQHSYYLGVGVKKLPYPHRVFSLPKTHIIKHTEATSDEHIDFIVWVLSFFAGMRLTTTEAGFVDATPIKPGYLTDFSVLGASLKHAIRIAECFWMKNLDKPRNTKRFIAAVHALFLGQNPRNFQFEDFIYLYTSIDACYALTKGIRLPEGKRHHHGERTEWICKELGIKVPEWGIPDSKGKHELSYIRNNTMHEALFLNAPLGFAIDKASNHRNLPLEMAALVCRLLVALIGVNDRSYLESPVDTRQLHSLNLSLEKQH